MITIRPVEEADLDAFFDHQADEQASAVAAFPSRDRDAHLAHWRKSLVRADAVNRTVVADGRVAGNVVSWVSEGRRLVGYWIGRDFWGRGVATAALRAFVEEVRDRPLYAFVVPSNKGSIRVLQKAGFVLAADQPPADPDDVEELLFVLG